MRKPLPNHYKKLGLAPSATAAEIKSAFRHLAKHYHPDGANKTEEEDFKLIATAYDVLGNPVKRAQYDELYVLTFKPEKSKHICLNEHWVAQQFQELHNRVKVFSNDELYGDLVTEYALHLMSDEHIFLLKRNENYLLQSENIMRDIASKMDYKQALRLYEKWKNTTQVPVNEPAWSNILGQKKKQLQQQKWMPYLIILLAILISVFIYFSSQT